MLVSTSGALRRAGGRQLITTEPEEVERFYEKTLGDVPEAELPALAQRLWRPGVQPRQRQVPAPAVGAVDHRCDGYGCAVPLFGGLVRARVSPNGRRDRFIRNETH